MELLKLDERPAEYKWEDVTFLIRTRMGPGDKFAVDTAGHLLENGKVTFKAWKLYEVLIKTFVVGWKGVTENGKEVPWDYDVFATRFPVKDKDVIMLLGEFIADTVNIFGVSKGTEALKNV
jgi:hypothetical protein